MDRTGWDAAHGPEGRRQLSGELADQLNLLGEVGGEAEEPAVARALHAAVLEGAAALQRGGDVAGDEQDPRAVRPGRDGRGQDVAGPRAADAQAGAEPAADAGVAVGHEAGPLLVRRHDRLRSGPL